MSGSYPQVNRGDWAIPPISEQVFGSAASTQSFLRLSLYGAPFVVSLRLYAPPYYSIHLGASHAGAIFLISSSSVQAVLRPRCTRSVEAGAACSKRSLVFLVQITRPCRRTGSQNVSLVVSISLQTNTHSPARTESQRAQMPC